MCSQMPYVQKYHGSRLLVDENTWQPEVTDEPSRQIANVG